MKRLAAILVLAAVGCDRGAPPPAPAKGGPARKPRVRIEPASAGDVAVTIEAVGSLEAAEEIRIPARVSGVIDDLNFKEGDTVGPDTVLLTVEIERYRLAEERAKADHDRAVAALAVAETVYKNRLNLFEEGKRQQKEWITEEQLATWKADAEKAKAESERARVDWELAKRDHAFARVRPPVAGVINRKRVSRGEFVRADTEVATILNLSALYVRFAVPEMEAQRLTRDAQLTFELRHDPGRPRKARLFYMAQKADESTRAVECKAEVLDRDGALRAGGYVTITATLGTRRAVTVPERAVLPTDRGFVVFVVDSARKARSVTVRPGLRSGDRVEILEGLEAGQLVVVDGGATLRDGAEVEAVGGQG